ncbi:MAG TPA: metallophosphoesterase, partial [Chloroflexota bacterium]|nr:metallophosphoesterase [Chloroflexota bacterium]
MRVLHTADWHLNDTLGRIDRRAHLRAALDQIAGLLDTHNVDVLLVAGDVFSERSRAEQLRDSIKDIQQAFSSFLQRGGTMVAISGNHDNPVFFETLQHALDLVAPGQAGPHGTHPTGRLYVAPNPRLLRLADRLGQGVQFALMPYPTSRYLRGEAVHFGSVEDKHRAIQSGFLKV